MAAVIASPAGALILAGIAYDIARLITPDEPRRPPPARLRGRRTALEEAERRLVGLRLHHRVGAATYQRRMSRLARGQRRTITGPANAAGGRHG
ncbi:hypothetical protein [Streptomyces sp. HUAS TT20]|uniref:hypothetical protein n=1 Tax=Streptomyces sp. HUAS TT20 TaxID=3447509 RepID=UPI0021DAC6CB|nr:hypothetical protein [Streptomyces sp. HUAS 15-9]UXY32306.1 hypothetical protein N8I87_41280 [Streptomyces sp. HUAS 15-9]